MQKILIMGLPGAGKTTIARELKKYLEQHNSINEVSEDKLLELGDAPIASPFCNIKVDWYNADDVRKYFNDWDFSHEGRIRQSIRMATFALKSTHDYVICDFVAPLEEMRSNFDADWTIWMDTIDNSRFSNTDNIFTPPCNYDFRVIEQDAVKWAEYIGSRIVKNQRRPIFNSKKETALILGRWQPWHAGHRELFKKALEKTGQVIILVRDCYKQNSSNPFTYKEVEYFIRRDLDPLYQGLYEIQLVPNILDITYGRDVGYTISKVTLPEEIENISATKIRKSMGIQQ